MGKNQSKLWLFVAGGALILIIAAGILLSNGGKSKGKSGKSGSSDISGTGDPTQNPGNSGNSGKIGADGLPEDGVTPEFLLAQYKEWAQYPPNSRPITNDHRDIVFPFVIEVPALMMADDPNSKELNNYKCHLQPKTWAVIGPNADMYVKLECKDPTMATIPVQVLDHKVWREKEWDGTRASTVRADFNDDGRDGDETAKDNVITFKWRPTKNDWGNITIEADIVYAKNKKAKVTTHFFSSPNKPAEVTGTFRESTNEGSLIIHSTVVAYKAGTYHLEANLKEAKEGNFLAYATFDGPLKQGTNEVDFLYFGKILKDKGYDGPYIITDVRGHRVNLPIDPEWANQGEAGLKKIQAAKSTEPDKELVIPFREEYKTKPYMISVFAGKEWESAEKSARIKELQSMASSK
ncbi:MAG TPA: hypothetical protein PK453_08285 [Leptospiraceae bacterium]|nr:hypothetical protein [Leptospiraceae bacterium]HMY66900.1 hypothetical protein [Leptospiraceae bacterium]HNF13653.1 hypothetical protein [Leptospiraceae bacterium]HNF25838.1 hypothetical protein [Leptospiraceae bacterium]HNI97221.1 hypothetical protein [Leptospiraceae bacterium]